MKKLLILVLSLYLFIPTISQGRCLECKKYKANYQQAAKELRILKHKLLPKLKSGKGLSEKDKQDLLKAEQKEYYYRSLYEAAINRSAGY